MTMPEETFDPGGESSDAVFDTKRRRSESTSTTVSEEEKPRPSEACCEPTPWRKEQNGQRECGGKRQRLLELAARKGGRGVVNNADVLVRIPMHSSVLSHPCVTVPTNNTKTNEIYGCDGQKGLESDTDASTLPSLLHLELRCHHPGVLWRGLLPMIFASSENPRRKLRDENARADVITNYRDSEKNAHIQFENTDSDESSTSSRKRNRYSQITLPQRVLLGLGLEDAVNRYHQEKNYHSWELKMIDDHNEEDPRDDNRTENKLFYERRVRLPLELLPCSNSAGDGDGDGKFDGDGNDVAQRANRSSIRRRNSKISVVVWIFPPLKPPSDIDRTPFAGIVSQFQAKVSIQTGRMAWLSTLGGGYFGIKSLEKSLWLSRQQKNLAIWLGDTKMARQCTLNEAYNWMYSGRFKLAGSILDDLDKEVARTRGVVSSMPSSSNNRSSNSNNNEIVCSYFTTDDKKILQQCSTARLCLRRLRKLSKMGLQKYHFRDESPNDNPLKSNTQDDFQRFRIVSC